MSTDSNHAGTAAAGTGPVRGAMDAQVIGRVNAAALKALGDVAARRKWAETKAGSPLTTNQLCAEIARLNLVLEGMVTIAESFTQAAHDARDALNGAGAACPASIVLAAESARNFVADTRWSAAGVRQLGAA